MTAAPHFHLQPPKGPSRKDGSRRLDDVRCAIQRSVDFYRRVQLPHGEFQTQIATTPDLAQPEFDSSPFTTTFVLYALSHLERNSVRDLTEPALRFLRSEQELGGIWRYYSRRQFKRLRIPPDLDDTACASFALRRFGWRTPRNQWIFRYCRDASGRFFTWVARQRPFSPRVSLMRTLGDLHARLMLREPPVHHRNNPRFQNPIDMVPLDDVDPVVNANAILYLGQTQDTIAAIRYLVDFIQQGGAATKFSLYYGNPLSLYYMVARAYRHHSSALHETHQPMLRDLNARQQRDGSFGSPLSTGLAACALLTLEPRGNALAAAIDSLLRSQGTDGAWDADVFYNGPAEFWGSRELTTAFALESLVRYLSRSEVNDAVRERHSARIDLAP